MIRTHILHDDGRVDGNAPIEVACAPIAEATVWVDLLDPTPEELLLLSEKWHFHPLAIEDVSHHQKRSKYERYATHGFVVTQALDRSTPSDPLDTVPISVFLRPSLVVSVRPKDVAAVEVVFRALATYPERIGTHADRILHALVDAVIDEYTLTLYDFEARVDALEEDAAANRQSHLVEDLVRVRRDLLMIRRMTLPQIELVRRFVDAENGDLGGGARIYFRDVLDHLTIIQEQTALLLEICNGALQVHSNLVNERLNQVMKYMAIVSTLLLPMTVISGIFGMNFDVIPIAHHGYGFWVAVGMMLGSAVVLLGVFRARRWF
ncbi:MAG: magnesium transporter CorA family protein [Pseudomonadota bacterium]|nr:magnesium transporter CorA family protein [Pseudomonadota bacterium]